MSLKNKIDFERLPKHIAIIMDGNGRWANDQGLERTFGHRTGVSAVKTTVETCAEIGIKFLTLYTFSTENWNRPQEEVDALMQLLVQTISQEKETLLKNNISLSAIGNLERLPKDCYEELMQAIADTKQNNSMQLNLALSYSSRWEILEAAKKMAQEYKTEKLNLEDINEANFSNYLTTGPIPDPELMIRTSGEHRISNYLLWQLAYAEFYFTDKLWPDFNAEDLFEAIIAYQKRERRFGKTGEQVKI